MSQEQLPDLKYRNNRGTSHTNRNSFFQNFAPYNNENTEILIDGYESEEFEEKKRSRRHDTGSVRLLSSSAFSKISETLGTFRSTPAR